MYMCLLRCNVVGITFYVLRFYHYAQRAIVHIVQWTGGLLCLHRRALFWCTCALFWRATFLRANVQHYNRPTCPQDAHHATIERFMINDTTIELQALVALPRGIARV